MKQKDLTAARLEELIEEATTDAHDESKQALGFQTMLEEGINFPFRTRILGVDVVVEGVELTYDDRIVAVSVRGRSRQRISLLDLPLPDPPPPGSEWIHAYRRFAQWR